MKMIFTKDEMVQCEALVSMAADVIRKYDGVLADAIDVEVGKGTVNTADFSMTQKTMKNGDVVIEMNPVAWNAVIDFYGSIVPEGVDLYYLLQPLVKKERRFISSISTGFVVSVLGLFGKEDRQNAKALVKKLSMKAMFFVAKMKVMKEIHEEAHKASE